MEQKFWIPTLINSIRVIDFQYIRVPKDWSYDSHRHVMFEFVYVISGGMEELVNQSPYTLRSEDAILIKPGIYHHTPPITEDTDLLIFHFEVEDKRIHELLQMIHYPVIHTKNHLAPETDIANFIKEFIHKYGDFLKKTEEQETIKNPDSMYSAIILLEIQSCILHLISLISNYFYHKIDRMESTSIHPSHINLAHEAAYLIETQAKDNLQISELANKLNVDRSYLSRCFKNVYGMPPHVYLTNVRIRKAKNLLVDTQWSIEKIARELDFSSSAHFSKTFLKAVGQTPLKFRNRSKQQDS